MTSLEIAAPCSFGKLLPDSISPVAARLTRFAVLGSTGVAKSAWLPTLSSLSSLRELVLSESFTLDFGLARSPAVQQMLARLEVLIAPTTVGALKVPLASARKVRIGFLPWTEVLDGEYTLCNGIAPQAEHFEARGMVVCEQRCDGSHMRCTRLRTLIVHGTFSSFLMELEYLCIENVLTACQSSLEIVDLSFTSLTGNLFVRMCKRGVVFDRLHTLVFMRNSFALSTNEDVDVAALLACFPALKNLDISYCASVDEELVRVFAQSCDRIICDGVRSVSRELRQALRTETGKRKTRDE